MSTSFWRDGRTRTGRAANFAARPWAAALLAICVALLSLFPFLYLFSSGVSVSTIRELFDYPDTWPVIRRSLELTGVIVAMCLIIGVGAAYLIVRTNIPLRRSLTVLLALPLAIPGFVSAYAAYSGNLLIAPQSTIVSTFWGACTIMALTLYPYIFLACVVAIRNLDPAQEEVARGLGCSAWSVFWRVTVPQLRPAMAPAALIVGLHVLSEYGAVSQLDQPTLTTTIVAEMTDYGHYAQARSLSLLLVGIAFVLLMLGLWMNGRSRTLSVSSQVVRSPARQPLGVFRFPALIAIVGVVVVAVGPTAAMTLRGLWLGAERVSLDWDLVFRCAANSLFYGLGAGLAATLVGLPVSWLDARRPSSLSRVAERAIWLAHGMPAAVLALALVFIGAQLVPSLYKTPWLLIAAYVILFLPLAVTNQAVGLQAAPAKFDDAAASLGAGPLRRLARISLPIASPGFATGALLVGLDAAKELTSTLMLVPFNTDTLATRLWTTTNGESLDFAAAAPYALMLILLGSVPVWLIVRRTLRHMD